MTPSGGSAVVVRSHHMPVLSVVARLTCVALMIITLTLGGQAHALALTTTGPDPMHPCCLVTAGGSLDAKRGPGTSVHPVVKDPQAEPAQQWLEQFGQQTVDELTATNTPATFGTLRPIMTWADSYLDGTDPQALPVPLDQWAAAISVDSKPIGIMVIARDDKGVWEGHIVDDPQLAGAAAASVRGSMLVHDPTADAWYMVTDTTVRAVGDNAATLLAGPIDLAQYSAILHARIEPQVLATHNGARTETGVPSAIPLWMPLMAVALLIIVVAIATSRHERRVLAPQEKE